ncbi:MAG: aminotransferase class I/II-fold pyridoxal phosphate-dependent enzyme [Planctomycetota bacterium]|nr:aminotransferase class I/II-fold pyridoxal phosphate-dependent enzyme [Planctomycetota bacterium]
MQLDRLARISCYKKPDCHPHALQMDTNENMCLPRGFIARLAADAMKRVDFRQYPDGLMDELTRRLGKFVGISPEHVAVGSGSDQLLDLLLSIIHDRRSLIVTVRPTFSFFLDRCRLHGIKVKEVPLREDLSLDARGLLSEQKAGLCYICSPNNPTGNQFERETVLDIARRFKGLVLIDEAYVEFARYSLKRVPLRFPNVVVLGTMSKAFGLAGARVGYATASLRVARLLRDLAQCPYPVSSMSLALASCALQHTREARRTWNFVKAERERVSETMRRFPGVRVFPSDANFILFNTGGTAQKIYRSLLDRSVLVRRIGKAGGHEDCLRVTIGTRAMNDTFLRALFAAVNR